MPSGAATGSKTPDKKNMRKLPGKIDSTVSRDTMKDSIYGVWHGALTNKLCLNVYKNGKNVQDAQPEHLVSFCCTPLQVSLRPGMKSMKLGSSAGRTKTTTPTSDSNHAHPEGAAVTDEDNSRSKPASEAKQKSVIPRTRDDSSDEEDHMSGRPQGPLLETMPPLMGHAPILPFPGSYPPPPHLIPMHGRPEFYGPRGGRGIVGPAPNMPPHSIGSSGAGILPHRMPPPPMVSHSVRNSRGGIMCPLHLHLCIIWPVI